MKLLLATANEHKLHELAALLDGARDLQLLSLRDFPDLVMPDETGATMAENARLKALHCAQESGLNALADDSGIEVDALGGAPGVRSARWVAGSDADRTQALLQALQSTPAAERGAQFRCALCLVQPDGSTRLVEAICRGRVADAPRGENGFGYDPIFEITAATGAPAEYSGHTLAEAPPEVKALVSHRARALREMAEIIREHGL